MERQARSLVARRPVSVAAIAYAFWIAMVGTTLPTPLYPLYEQRYGFSAFIVTVIFATYAVGVIATLMLLGGVSDAVGRRPVLLVGLAASGLSAVLFILARGLAPMLVARIFSGISAGLFTGSGTAAIADIAGPERRTVASGVATAVNLGGLGSGTLLAGALAAWVALPLRLPFWSDLALLVPAVLGLLVIGEPLAHRRGGQGLRVQRLQVPREVRPTFVPAALAAFASFAMGGLFSAVAPSFLVEYLGLSSPVLAGAIVFALFVASAVGQLAVRRVPAPLPLGSAAVIVGAALVAGGLAAASLALLLAGAIVAGLGQGFGVGGGIDALNERSPAERRGEIASSFFIVSYFALSIPIIGVGLAAQAIGLRAAGLIFSALVAALAAASLALSGRESGGVGRRLGARRSSWARG